MKLILNFFTLLRLVPPAGLGCCESNVLKCGKLSMQVKEKPL